MSTKLNRRMPPHLRYVVQSSTYCIMAELLSYVKDCQNVATSIKICLGIELIYLVVGSFTIFDVKYLIGGY